MIANRFLQQLKQQHWTGVFIELVIVIVGVFIGLQVDNWNQARQDHAAESVYLHSMVRDLDAIQSTVQVQIDFENQVAHFVNQALDEIDAPPSQDRQIRLGMLLSQLGARKTLKIESPTFQELQSSGRLGLIRDPVLRGRIVNYFFLIRSLESGLDQNNEVFTDNGYNVFLRNHGVALVVWNQARMHEPSMFQSTLGGTFQKLMQAHYGRRLLVAKNAVLASPPGAPFWDQLRQQIDWRAYNAGYNEIIAMHLKQMTADLQARIIVYLKKHPG